MDDHSCQAETEVPNIELFECNLCRENYFFKKKNLGKDFTPTAPETSQ